MTKPPTRASALAAILERREKILAGVLPSTAASIRECHAFMSGDADIDRQHWCERMLMSDTPKSKLQRKLIAQMAADGSDTTLLRCREGFAKFPEILARIDVYLAFNGEPDAALRELADALTLYGDSITRARVMIWALGVFRYTRRPFHGMSDDWDMAEIIEAGQGQIKIISEGAARLAAESEPVDPNVALTVEEVLGIALGSSARAADTKPAAASVAVPAATMHGLIVVPPFAAPTPANKSDRHRVRADFHSISGKPLALVPTGNVAAHMAALTARAPHLSGVYETLLNDAARSAHARFNPTILVGGPGSGKSWSARQLAAVMGLPVTVFNAAGTADGMFAGIAAHWSSTGPSVPLGFIKYCLRANPLIVIDEIEKAATGGQNGRLHDALLNFFDRGSAAVYRDPSLEVAVDLSAVNYILTANSIDGVPAPLLDRCRVLQVPDPDWQHVPTLVRHIVDEIAKDRGSDSRWYPPIAPDELDVIATAWGGGSIRKLRRAVEILIDGRDAAREMM